MAEPTTKKQNETSSAEMSESLKELLKGSGPGVSWMKVPEELDASTIRAAKERFYQRMRAQKEAAKATEASQNQTETVDAVAIQRDSAEAAGLVKPLESDITEASLVETTQNAGDKIIDSTNDIMNSKTSENEIVEQGFRNLEDKVLKMTLTESSIAGEEEAVNVGNESEVNYAGDENNQDPSDMQMKSESTGKISEQLLQQKKDTLEISAKKVITGDSPFMEDNDWEGSHEVALS